MRTVEVAAMRVDGAGLAGASETSRPPNAPNCGALGGREAKRGEVSRSETGPVPRQPGAVDSTRGGIQR